MVWEKKKKKKKEKKKGPPTSPFSRKNKTADLQVELSSNDGCGSNEMKCLPHAYANYYSPPVWSKARKQFSSPASAA
jgi:hypothetical protein